LGKKKERNEMGKIVDMVEQEILRDKAPVSFIGIFMAIESELKRIEERIDKHAVATGEGFRQQDDFMKTLESRLENLRAGLKQQRTELELHRAVKTLANLEQQPQEPARDTDKNGHDLKYPDLVYHVDRGAYGIFIRSIGSQYNWVLDSDGCPSHWFKDCTVFRGRPEPPKENS